jgi:tRNA(fMet)-specific endonuclease VapC
VGVLIDTTVFVEVERRGGELRSLFDLVGEEEAAISVVTASDLLHGVHRAESAVRRGRRQAFVEVILTGVPVIPFDLAVAREHARTGADASHRL